MRKLELSDIASYLPYDLDCHVKGKYENNEDEIPCVYTIIGFEQTGSITWIEMYNKVDYEIRSVKPILRPMTDLVKPIVVEGYNNNEEFVPLLELIKTESPDDYDCAKYDYDSGNITSDGLIMNDINRISYKGIELLNQWHFDYRDLIGQGLAIDINILKKE